MQLAQVLHAPQRASQGTSSKYVSKESVEPETASFERIQSKQTMNLERKKRRGRLTRRPKPSLKAWSKRQGKKVKRWPESKKKQTKIASISLKANSRKRNKRRQRLVRVPRRQSLICWRGLLQKQRKLRALLWRRNERYFGGEMSLIYIIG